MIEFQEVMQRVKETLLTCQNKEKILDRDIAEALGLDPQYFAVIKRRKKIPYEQLAYFSHSRKLNMNWLLMKQKPQYLT